MPETQRFTPGVHAVALTNSQSGKVLPAQGSGADCNCVSFAPLLTTPLRRTDAGLNVEGRPNPNYDLRKVGQNGMIGMATMAGTFGLLVGGFGGIARGQTRLLPRLVASVAPVVAGAVSVYVERSLERATNISATPMPVPTDRVDRHGQIYHGILPAFFAFFNLSYALSSITKYPPASARGFLTSVLVSGIGSFSGKAGMELYSQNTTMHMPGSMPPPRPEVGDIALARAITQIPAMAFSITVARVYRNRAIPRPAQLALPVLIAVSYSQRGVVLGALKQVENKSFPR